MISSSQDQAKGPGVRGEGDLFERLASEHRQVSSLLARIIGARPQERLRLFGELREKLLAHAKAEEETVYAVALNRLATPDAAQGVRQHEAIKSLVRTLEWTRDAGASEWMTTLHDLQGQMDDHVREEEATLLPQLRREMTPKEAEVLARHYRLEYDRVMSSLRNGRPREERAPSP